MAPTSLPIAPAIPGAWMKVLMKLAGTDAATLQQCPRQDWDNVRAVGEIMICTWLYQASLFALVGHLLFAAPGQIRSDVIAVAMFIATFIMFIDSYMVMRSGWHLSGIEELKRGGLDISGGPAARLKAGFFLAIRVGLSIGLAQLTALFVSLLIFRGDVDARLEDAYLKANGRLFTAAATLVDGGITRATDAVEAQTARIDALSAQVNTLRQNEIDPDPRVEEARKESERLLAAQTKADEAVRAAEVFVTNEFGGIRGSANNSGQMGYGPRWRAANKQLDDARAEAKRIADALNTARQRLDSLRASAPIGVPKPQHDQLSAFEESLKAENAKLANAKSELAALIKDREHAIRSAVESAPDHVNRETGFLAKIVTLEQIAQEDTKITAVILLIDIVSFGFELAAVLAKITSYVPSTYAALLARDAYMVAVRIAEEMMAALKAIDDKQGIGAPTGPPDPGLTPNTPAPPLAPTAPAGSAPVGAPPIKRGRGRPRKHPLPVAVKDANGQTS